MTDTQTDQFSSGRRDVIASGVILLGCGLAEWSLRTTPYIDGDFYGADPGPAFLPRIIIGLLVVTSVILAATGAFKVYVNRGGAANLVTRALLASFAAPVGLVLSLAALLWLAIRVGFLPVALPFAIFWCAVIALQDGMPRTWRTFAFSIGGGVLAAGVVYLVFVRLIGVPLA